MKTPLSLNISGVCEEATYDIPLTSPCADQVPMRQNPEYAVAKAAQDHLTRCWALKYAPEGVRVNTVAPGPIHSDLIDRMAGRFNLPLNAFKTKLASFVPMNQVGDPEDVAAAVLFLSSTAAKYITGSTLNVGGGGHLQWSAPQLPAANTPTTSS